MIFMNVYSSDATAGSDDMKKKYRVVLILAYILAVLVGLGLLLLIIILVWRY